MKRHLSLLLPILLLFFVAGCDSNDEPEDDTPLNGSFNISVSGDINTSFEGTAVFGGGIAADGTSGFGLVLLQDGIGGAGTSNAVYIANGSGGRPGTGTYSIVDYTDDTEIDELSANQYVGIYTNSTQTDGVIAFSISGTFTVSDSDENRLRGEINFTASGTNFAGEEVSFTIVGTFTAIGGTGIAIPADLTP